MGWVGVLLLSQDVGGGALCGSCTAGVFDLLVPCMSSLRIFIIFFVPSKAGIVDCMSVLPSYGVAALSCPSYSAL